VAGTTSIVGMAQQRQLSTSASESNNQDENTDSFANSQLQEETDRQLQKEANNQLQKMTNSQSQMERQSSGSNEHFFTRPFLFD